VDLINGFRFYSRPEFVCKLSFTLSSLAQAIS